MSDPERYLTADELQRELPFHRVDINPDLTEAEYDQLLQDTLGAESGRIERWVDVSLQTTETTAEISRPDSVPRRELPLPERPIQSVASITVDGETLTAGDDFAVEDTHLVLLKDGSLHTWPTDYRAIEVTWSHGRGWDTEVPGDAKETLVRLCRARLQRTHTDGLESESTGDGGSYNYEPDEVLQHQAYAVIDDYDAPSYYGGSSVV